MQRFIHNMGLIFMAIILANVSVFALTFIAAQFYR